MAGVIQIATDHGPREIRALRDRLIATYGQQGKFQRRHDQLIATGSQLSKRPAAGILSTPALKNG